MKDNFLMMTIAVGACFLLICLLIVVGVIFNSWNVAQEKRIYTLEQQADSLWVTINKLESTVDSLKTTVTGTGAIVCASFTEIKKAAQLDDPNSITLPDHSR